MTNLKKILVYIDGTEQSITAAQYAICLASLFKAELIALYVVNTKAIEDLLKARIFLQDEQIEYEHDIEADAERYLNYVEDLAIKKGITIIKKTLRAVYITKLPMPQRKALIFLSLASCHASGAEEMNFMMKPNGLCELFLVRCLSLKDEDKVLEMYNSLV